LGGGLGMKTLFPDQQSGLELIRSAYRRHRRVVAKAPTGWGKTAVAAKIIRAARDKGNRVAFVVDSISLIDQTVVRLGEEGIHEVGVIQANHPLTDYAQPVQVISVQTLRSRGWKFLDFQLVIIDEVHCWHRIYGKWMAAWGAVPFLGLSATPWKPGLGDHWEELVDCGSIGQMIELGRLSPYRIFAVAHPDLKGVKIRSGDYVTGELSERMSNGGLVSDLVGKYRQHHNAGKTLVFAVDRAHAAKIQAEYNGAGIPAGYIDANVPPEDRKVIADQFHRHELEVVVSVGCLVKGVDWDVRCIQLARPTRSESLFVQIIGRGLRTAKGKDHCLILDHSDTTIRLGLPEEIEERFTDFVPGKISDTAKREIEEPMSSMCASCSFIKPPRTPVCPQCEFKAQRQTTVQHNVEADLIEITKHQRKLNRTTTPDEKAEFYGGLKHYAASKGYRPGWAANQYREKFGVWPNAFKDTPPCAPNADVRGWIKHQAIKFRSRRNAA